ncbi:hypothetical protein N008_02490 [Hymenobacter sp. APR13]|nr:hypothetical protein N008_02490 [Hymenobacter sp. APR13]
MPPPNPHLEREVNYLLETKADFLNNPNLTGAARSGLVRQYAELEKAWEQLTLLSQRKHIEQLQQSLASNFETVVSKQLELLVYNSQTSRPNTSGMQQRLLRRKQLWSSGFERKKSSLFESVATSRNEWHELKLNGAEIIRQRKQSYTQQSSSYQSSGQGGPLSASALTEKQMLLELRRQSSAERKQILNARQQALEAEQKNNSILSTESGQLQQQLTRKSEMLLHEKISCARLRNSLINANRIQKTEFLEVDMDVLNHPEARYI